jgi:acetyltransferase-like isoleucine patch superfamily enzyme
MGSVILKGVHVGEGAIIGAGSVVTRHVPPFCLAAGAPARVLRRLGPEDAKSRASGPAPARPAGV